MPAIRAPGSFVAHSFGGMSDEWNYLVTCATYEIREATMPNPSQYKGRNMISMPVAVHTALFKWQLDLFWFNHQLTYGVDAGKKAKAIVIKRNYSTEQKKNFLEWNLDIPHLMCESVFDVTPEQNVKYSPVFILPLNIQIGLLQVLHTFDDEQTIELLDCDLFHFKPHPEISVQDDELYVSDIYERWHLKSLSDHRNVIEKYFENGGDYYNGGFVPIIGKVRTFKKIIGDWITIHWDILKCDWSENIKWWAGMYALQAACEKARVKMIAKDYCYIPGVYDLSPDHYIAHYCCDGQRFNKKAFPNIEIKTFEDNEFYRRLLKWPGLKG